MLFIQLSSTFAQRCGKKRILSGSAPASGAAADAPARAPTRARPSARAPTPAAGAPAHFKVGFVMRGRHLQYAGAELEIDLVIADDGNELLFARQFSRKRPYDVFADETGVAFVLRVYGDGGVAGNGLRAGRCDGEP